MKLFINDYDKESVEKAESLFFNGNGHLGIRGSLEEDYYDYYATNRETYINGFYDTKEIQYPEKMFGFTPTGESMISVIDGQTTLITIGDERFRINEGTIRDSKRYVDMSQGVTVRELTWTSPSQKTTRITMTRLVSFVHKNLFLHKFDFERIDHQEPITLETHLNIAPIRTIDKDDPRMSHELTSVEVTAVNLAQQSCQFQTRQALLPAEVKWQLNVPHTAEKTAERILLQSTLASESYVKTLSYARQGEEHSGLELTFDEVLELQKAYLADFWQDAQIRIVSEADLEESVNYSSYALLQSLGTDGKTSIAAKGLSGSGYEGHYFWDTEMFIFPVFLHLRPELAKAILSFRINTLEGARKNRELFGYQQGALYPWRTISGSESSAFFEAGSAQHHINADIAYAFIRYFQYTDDFELMLNGGLDVLVETSRLFLEIGYEKNGRFHLDKVTGPDEYTVLVNDNYYTNRMVGHQLEWTAKIARTLAAEQPQAYQKLVERLHLTEEELSEMIRCSQIMEQPFDETLGILAQDRDFLNKAHWPFSKEETQYPLLLNYHPLVIYRYQIAKQADAVLALMLFQDEFDPETVRKTVEYYDQVTTHDSSLSYSTFSIVYSRLGELEKGYRYFLENARMDLDNLHHNTKDGIHTASMGGTFLSIVYGFCNLTIKDNSLQIEPHLPKEIREIHLPIQFQGKSYYIHVTQDEHWIEIRTN